MKAIRVFFIVGLGAAAVTSRSAAQIISETVDLAAVQKIRDEGMTRSRLGGRATYLPDVTGARPTTPPASRRANDWAAETFRSWGLANVRLEPWDSAFGRGWELVN